MPKFIVSVPEVWYQDYVVEAENENDAIKQVRIGRGVAQVSPEYSHIIYTGEHLWKVKKA